ncbi:MULTISPECIES: AMP-binding protein [unclassified Moraxella]|uniref:AMP-binding protein n=1 Tax=unclassified Moraxella TaxID=2685852 RepID=UPI003AF44FA8
MESQKPVTHHYQSYIDQFNIDQLESQILKGCRINGINAYVECCGRHAESDKANKVALVHEDTNGNTNKITYAELDRLSGKMANLLTSLGVKKGDRVSTMLSRTPNLLAVIVGAWRIGAVYQPLFTAFGVEAIEYRLEKADTKVVFTDAHNREKFNEIKNLPKMVMVGTAEEAQLHGDLQFDSLMAEQSDECEPVMLTGEEPFLQMFTSGTVGKSKGVAVPLKALTAFYLYMVDAVGLTDEDNFWNMADPGWAYGLYYAITGPLLLGATTHFNEAGFNAQHTLDFIKNHKITNLAASPTAFRMMKSSGVFDKKADELPLLTRISSAGETLNTEVVTWINDNLDAVILDHYGQTELGMACCCHHILEHDKPIGSMGVPLAGYRLAVLDENHNEVANGVEGQLAVDVVNSPSLFFQGYTWNEKNPFENGYYLTGDMVEKHDDGTFWFSGRDDDIITTAGYRVGPTDVENTVMEHEAVVETAAIGVPDEIRGHVIKSYVVLKDGYSGSDELAKEIQSLVHERLSAHAYPRIVEFIDALPKTPSGKVQRFMLRNMSVAH